MLEAYLLTLAGVIAAQASPGPNLIAVASVSLAQGRRAGLFVVAGVSSGMLVWSLATAYGLATVLEWFPHSLTAMRVVGGGYLLWLAIKGVRAAIAGKPGSIRAARQPLSNERAWLRGFLVLLTNPKAVMMWAAVATFLFGAGLSPAQVLAFGPVGALSGLIIYGGYALLFSTGLAARSYSRFARWIEAAFGAAFGALGGRLLVDGIREMRS
ncbi:MAG: LysE family translocator [Roseitalea sp.]|jgi:threonine/homoserine/homoserine lactone efflux protein|nr:LysE family translocator [Roseitalea sp.]MBO6721708.1 LysE family translocator [Roseitalea sp.]MBO6743503.1 LysE family translocator [Roseitalea sp.]